MSKIQVTMDLLEFEKMQAELNFYKKIYKQVTDRKYVAVIDLDPEPDKEILEIRFKAKQFIQDHIESFGEEFEGFNNKITKVVLE